MDYVVFLGVSESPIVIEQAACTDHMNVEQAYAERISAVAAGE